ncbi:Alpha/Beta hydrolase protein [Mycena crocata]|nr:Alpha/Beta hydrolase protein [Mycena crocata]
MPHVSIISAGGPLSVAYTIATPNSPSAKAIDPALPTLVLLHPLYLGQMSLHHQFSDSRLRRFNLIALDLRGHGNSIGAVKPTYGIGEAVDDVVKFLEALHLPPVHLVGINLGSLIALELAALWPQRVVSLSLISPPSMEEPSEVAEGREEIYDYWKTGLGVCANEKADESALADAICGGLQLGVNNMQSPITALTRTLLTASMSNGAPPKVKEYHSATVAFFTARPRPTLRGISCPVQLVHCSADIAYSRESTDELLAALRTEGVDVRLHDVPHAVQINPLIHEMVVECAVERNIPMAKETGIVSPYAAALFDAGLRPDEDSDSEDSD